MYNKGKVKNLFISGGAGFIGINLVKYFLGKKEYKITVFDNISTGNYKLLKEIVIAAEINFVEGISSHPDTLSFIKGDIRDRDSVEAGLQNQDYVIHLAAETGVIPSLKNPLKDAEVNINGTLNLLDYSVKHKIKKFIFASSAAPLGGQAPPMDETKIPAPLSPYGASKLAGEGYCSAFYGSFDLRTIVLRFSNVYGPFSYDKGSVVAEFIRRIISGDTIHINGDGSQTRDFLFTNDIAKVIYLLLDKKYENFEIFQLGTGVESSLNDLVILLRKITGKNIDLRYGQKNKGEIIRNYASINKISEFLKYNSFMDLKKGLEITYDWFLKTHK